MFDFRPVYSYAVLQGIFRILRFFLQSHSTSYTADSARRCNEMGKFCEVCGKGAMSGNLVSHSNRKTRRIWAPNVQRVNVIVNGTPKKMNVCTRCLRSGKVQRNV